MSLDEEASWTVLEEGQACQVTKHHLIPCVGLGLSPLPLVSLHHKLGKVVTLSLVGHSQPVLPIQPILSQTCEQLV